MIGLLIGQWQRIALYAALAAVVMGFAYFKGYQHGRDKLDQYVAAQAVEAVRIVTRQGAVTQKVITRYVKVAGETQTVTQTIDREVVRYVDKNPGYCLDPDWRRLHDASAANTVPGGPGRAPDGLRAPPAPPLEPGFPYRSPGAPNRDGELRSASSVR